MARDLLQFESNVASADGRSPRASIDNDICDAQLTLRREDVLSLTTIRYKGFPERGLNTNLLGRLLLAARERSEACNTHRENMPSNDNTGRCVGELETRPAMSCVAQRLL